LLAPWPPTATAAQLGTAFTYQGELLDGGLPVTDMCDFEFTLWDDPAAGVQIGATNAQIVAIADGRFTVVLDFGPAAIVGEARWLQIDVCCSSPCSPALTPLLPRQELTPSPHALALPGLHTQESASAPNIIGGFGENDVQPGMSGATISGGGLTGESNFVADLWGTVGGGAGNTAGSDNGDFNDAQFATVGGGRGNVASATNATVAGGASNMSTNVFATVAGGQVNTASGINSAVGGGGGNFSIGRSATVGGGENNRGSADFSTVGGGRINNASGIKATVGGGENNVASGNLSTVPGGEGNQAGGQFSFAGGHLGIVRDAAASLDADGDEGTFIWADATPVNFESTGPNQFLIRANGGVGINTNVPGAALHVGGTAGVDGIMFPDGTLQTTAAAAGADTLGALSCANGEIAKWNGAAWACGPDLDTDTNTLGALVCASGEIAKWNGAAWACAPDDAGAAGNTLDAAYDQGGAGLGRTITADSGPVSILGPDGLTIQGGVSSFGPISSGTITIDGTAGSISRGGPIDFVSDDLITTGGVGIGVSAPQGDLHIEREFSRADIIIDSYPQGFGGGIIRARLGNGTPGAPTVIGSGNQMMRISAEGWDGVGFGEGASIVAISQGGWSGSSHPTKMDFRVADNGATTPTTAITIRPNGRVGIGVLIPTEQVDVAGNVHASGAITSGSSITIDGTANTINSTGNLGLQTAGGNVGIGTSAPVNPLHIVSGVDDPLAGPVMRLESTGSNPVESGRIRFSEGAFSGVGGYVHYDGSANQFHIGTNSVNADPVNDVDAITIARGATNVGIGTAPVSGVTLNVGGTGDSAVVLPTGAIDRLEILDEPGVAHGGFDTEICGFASCDCADLPSIATDLEIRTITAPSTGWVLAIATIGLQINHTFGTTSTAFFGISKTSATFDRDPIPDATIPAGAAGGQYEIPVTIHTLISVSAGANTFYLVSRQGSGFCEYCEVELTLVYLPTAYGSTLAASSSGSGDPTESVEPLPTPSDELMMDVTDDSGRTSGVVGVSDAIAVADIPAHPNAAAIMSELEDLRKTLGSMRSIEERIATLQEQVEQLQKLDGTDE